MDRLIEYSSHHPWLAAAAVAVAVLVIVYELRVHSESLAGVSPQELVRLVNQGAVVIDLRPDKEYKVGHVAGARLMSEQQVLKASESLKRHKERPVVVYDETGSLGASAVRQLASQGFTKAFSLRGGLIAWRAENLPLTRT
jgi:rhodanese-related sulfurtransferase